MKVATATRVLAAALLMPLLLTACAADQQRPKAGQWTLYSVADSGPAVFAKQFMDQPTQGTPLDYLLRQAETAHAPDARPLLTDGVKVMGYTVSGNAVTVNLSDDYAKLTPLRQTVIEAGLTLQLTQLPDVKYVQLNCEALPAPRDRRAAADIVLTPPALRPQERDITLYFASGQRLASETRVIVVGENEQLPKYVLENLLSGTKNAQYRNVIPAGTTLLSVTVDRDTCRVNLSSAFLTGLPAQRDDQWLAVYSIVYTLTALPEVRYVELRVEGAPLQQYGQLAVGFPLTRDETATAP